MKVLCLASFPVEAACTRYRCVQFFPYLRDHGVECELHPFLETAHFASLYRRGNWPRKAAQLGLAALRRVRDLIAARKFDVVFIQREAALFGPPLFERLLTGPVRRPVVFDFDDAIFVPYVSPTYGKLGTLLKCAGKTRSTVQRSDHIIVGNDYLAEFARPLNDRVTVIPTVVGAEAYRPSPSAPPREVLTIGWIGSPTTSQYLRPLMPVLGELGARHRFEVKLVGANEEMTLPGTTVHNVEWSLAREVADFQSVDIGVYPIVENEWSVGKSGFKAIQFMAAGVPCVASPVGVNRTIITDGVNGLLAASPQEWRTKLSLLLTEPESRRQLGAAGRRTVEEKYSLQMQAPRLLNILREVVELREQRWCRA